MSYGRNLKSNFYTQGSGEIAMPPLGEIPPVLADTPELFSKNETVTPQNQQLDNEEPSDINQELDSSPDDVDFQEVESEQTPQVSQQSQKVKQDHPNFKSLREAAQKAEWERDLLKSQMLEMQRAMQDKQPASMQNQPQEIEEVDDFNFDVADDALLEGKHAKQLVQELKKVKKQLRQFHSQTSESSTEMKIRQNYPDFNDVVSAENVRQLNQEYPEIAQTLKDTPDLYNKASAAYSIMKKFGIYKDPIYQEDKMKAIKNSQKPRPVASVNPQQGDSPLSKANAFASGLTKDLQKQLLAEMAAARKGV